MTVFQTIYPENVFRYFEEISAIPHGSGNTERLREFLITFAKEHGLSCYSDPLGNVLIKKNASPGYEHAMPIILQGHTDMVCEKTPDAKTDMAKEGIRLRVSGDFAYAEGTTLGADNGIGIAMMLSLLDGEYDHPPIEAVFTNDEEIGMLGAMAFDPSVLSGKRLINLDSEDEGVFTVSCAGGNRTTLSLPVSRSRFSGRFYKITLSGLTGGHSGTEIHKKRANANRLLGSLLTQLNDLQPLRIHSFNGGKKDNAIPVEAEAIIAVENPLSEDVTGSLFYGIKSRYLNSDPEMTVTVSPCNGEDALDSADTQKILRLLSDTPDGVIRMSRDIKGLVETSLNLGIFRMNETLAEATFCLRSSVDREKERLTERLRKLASEIGASVRITGDYPGWSYRKDSPLRDIFTQTFYEQYGHEAKIEAIHAGLECGVFVGKIPGLDCLSFGPTLSDVHTYREKMSLSSVERTWNLLLAILKKMDQ